MILSTSFRKRAFD